VQRSIKDVLVDAKDASELMVDLAYAAVLFDDRDLAYEVQELEESLRSEIFRLRRLCLMAARSPQDADYFAGILQIASAMEKIGDAAEEIARVVPRRLGVPYELRRDLRHADEVVGRVPLPEQSHLCGANLAELAIPRETGLWVIAIKRGAQWRTAPTQTEVLLPGDILYVQGAEDGLRRLRHLAGLPDTEEAHELLVWSVADSLSVAVDLLVELKNMSEVAVGLAYSALLLNDKTLAKEVASLEERTDKMYDELERWVLAAGKTEIDPSDLRGLLHIGSAIERICHAAQEMVWVIEHGEGLHPIVGEALSEADEIVARFQISEESLPAGRSLGDACVRTKTGMTVLAVQRGNMWRYRPRRGFVLKAGDRVLATGPEDSVGLMAAFVG